MKNINYAELTFEPVFFERNRVYRITLGGLLFHDLFGDKPEDTNYPEEWIASGVPATLNGGDPHEGISKIKGTDVYLDTLLKAEPERMLGGRKEWGVLVKALDSSMRLPIQAHPDKAFSKKYLNSRHGKVEAWIILATRDDAEIYFGFEDRINEKIFLSAIKRNETDKDALVKLMHKIPVKSGDIFLIPAKAPHAIGKNILLVEVQEPTDFTITPEAWCGDELIREDLKYLGLGRDVALRCFDYSIYGDGAEEMGRKIPKKIIETDQYSSESLIGFSDTPCFAVNRHRIRGSLALQNAPAVYFVANGNGSINGGGTLPPYRKIIQKGDYFFLPFALSGLYSIQSGSNPLELVEVLPPEI
ncbi:MAG: class I mannose-6-phosphate isomerase [Treponema sp.]|jgi:mannose-6-phosphate isomerase|nr:class I mannose-6-phosphate isomerase [Treponema sp.]